MRQAGTWMHTDITPTISDLEGVELTTPVPESPSACKRKHLSEQQISSEWNLKMIQADWAYLTHPSPSL